LQIKGKCIEVHHMKLFLGRASLDSLKREAKALLSSLKTSDPAAVERLRASGHAPRGPLALHDAQIVIAREHGFSTWARLKMHLDLLGLPIHELAAKLAGLAFDGNIDGFRQGLKEWQGEEPLWLQVLRGALTPKMAATQVNEPVGPLSRPLIIYASFSRVSLPEDRQAVVESLLHMGADPNSYHLDEQWPDNPLPILFAASGLQNDPALTETLLQAGANPNDGESLYHSTEHRDLECVRVLLRYGAKVEEMVINHMLDAADVEGLRLLLDHADTITPEALTWAVTNECPLQILQMILDRGADIDGVRSRDGVTAYRLARRIGLSAHAEFLATRGARTDLDEIESVLALAAEGRVSEASARIGAIPSFWERLTPADFGLVETLAWHRNSEGVKAMIELGFPVDSPSREGDTALHAASYQGDSKTVQLLLEAGANVDARDAHYNGTPLGWTDHASMHRAGQDRDYAVCARLLVTAGATPPKSFGSEIVRAAVEAAKGN
jgi:ankyrin repeat protein